MIWIALVIPVAVAVFTGCVPELRHRFVWWEMILPISLGALVIAVFSWVGVRSLTQDEEYWGGWVKQASYYEDWDERVPCRHPRYTTDSKGNRHYAGNEHMFDVDYHPEVYEVVTSNGTIVPVSRQNILDLFAKFGGKKFKDLHRSYHTNDGDLWYANWQGHDSNLEPAVEPHSYENRVQAAQDSILSYADVSEKDVAEYGLYATYPKIWHGYKHHSALGVSDEADARLKYWNAKLGAKKRVRMWLLYFNGSQYLRDTGEMQERAWKGGNKNEVVVCVGRDDDGRVTWTHVFSWTEREDCKIALRDAAVAFGDNPELLVERMASIVDEKYEMVDWSKYDYLDVQMPTWSIVLTYLVVLVTSAGASWWSYRNEHQN